MMLLLLLLAIVSCVTHASESSGTIRGFTKMMNHNPAVVSGFKSRVYYSM
jgi:hypothetical protein